MYAKLHNNALMPAPNPVPYNGCSVANPPAETLRALGYKEVIYPDAGPADPAEEPGGEITTFQPVPMREVYTEDAEYIYVNFVPAEPEPEPTPADLREAAYRAEADQYLTAYHGYLAEDKAEQAEVQKAAYLARKAEIREQFPDAAPENTPQT